MRKGELGLSSLMQKTLANARNPGWGGDSPTWAKGFLTEFDECLSGRARALAIGHWLCISQEGR